MTWTRRTAPTVRRRAKTSTRARWTRWARPTIEELERRLAPANVAWTGGAGTLNWTDPQNWSTGAVPGAADDVTISVAVSGAISISSGAQAIHSLTDTSAPLVLGGGSLTLAAASTTSKNFTESAGALTASTGLTMNSATFAFNGGTVAGTMTLRSSALVIGAGSTGAASIALQGSDTLSGNVAAGQTLVVQGSSAGDATLTVADGVVNHGTILLDSLNSYTDAEALSLAGTFTNAADGLIQANLAGGGSRTISGTLINRGQITCNTLSFIQGKYYAAGGTITGPGYLFNCTLYELVSPAAPSTILVGGSGDTLATNNLPNSTIEVRSNGNFFNATLTVADGVVNHGTILLDSSVGSTVETLDTGKGTFTNAADGTILVGQVAGNGAVITGTLVNQGQLTCNAYAQIQGVVNQGQLTCNHFALIQGTYTAAGGTLSGSGYLDHCTLFITKNPAPTTIQVGGPATLASNNLPNITIEVGAGATLTAADGVVNHGTILLDSTGGYSVETLTTGTGTFTNAPDGTILVGKVAGNGVEVHGTLVNQGQIICNALTEFFGTYYAAGGTIAGSGYLWNCTLYVTASPTTRTTIVMVGTGNILATDNLPNTTIDVDDPSLFFDATLTVRDGLVNHGTIRLGSGAYPEILAIQGTLTNATDGTVQTDAPGARTITGNLINHGTLNFNVNTTLGSTGANLLNTGPFNLGSATVTVLGNSFTNGSGGVISGSGTFNAPGVTLINGGGVVVNSGTLNFVSSSLLVNDDGLLASGPGGTTTVSGNLLGQTVQASKFTPLGTTILNGSVALTAPQLLEVMSQDLGPVSAGFHNNFAYGTLILNATNYYTKLVDNARNSAGSGAEALYVNTLFVSGGTVNLNGLHVYARRYQPGGSVVGGSITVVPNGGTIDLNAAVATSLNTSNAVDDWTFFGRSGQGVTVAVNTGSGGTPAPVLPSVNFARVSLVGPDGSVLAAGSNTSSGATVLLPFVGLPTDGTYHVKVQSTGNTGNYVLIVSDASVHTAPLFVNQTTTGRLASTYSVDRRTFAAAADQQVRLNLISATNPGMRFDLTGPNGLTVFSGLTVSTGLFTLPTSGNYVLTAYTTGLGGPYAFQLQQTPPTNLNLGTPYQGKLPGSGQAQLFAVSVPAGQALSIQLSDSTPSDHVELYASLASPPTRATYDYGTSAAGSSPSLFVSLAAPGTWYILVYGESVPKSSSFTLTATASVVKLTGVFPDHAGNSAPATLTLSGAGFVPGTTVALVAPDGTTTVAPSSLSIDFFSQITATFPANLPPGSYALKVQSPGGSDTLAGAFTVSAGGSAQLQTDLVVPSALGLHTTETLYVKYANTGTVAMPAPLLVLGSSGNARPLLTLDQSRITQGLWTSAVPDGFSTSLSILGSGKTPGLLQPGESVVVPVYYAGLLQPIDPSQTSIPFNLGVINTTDGTPINWGALKAGLQPSWLSGQAWDAVYGAVTALAGNSAGSYVQMLDNNAQYLGRLGEAVSDVGRLWNFSILQAAELGPMGPLTSTTDLSLPAPGLPLTFDRAYPASLAQRYALGTLGRGWSSPWQEALATQADGTVVITSGSGDQTRYQPDSRNPGTYFSEAGDSSTLTAGPGGTYIQTQANGTTTVFLSTGQLSSVQDSNGNKITAAYNAQGQLTGLKHSSGAGLTITYNPAGLVATITDSSGRQAIYSYDPTNQYLVSVQTPAGTTQYTYTTGSGEAAHALASITFADGTHELFTYDALGRLASTALDNNAQRLNYTYDGQGEVTTTDLLGDASHVFYDYRDLPVKTQDALGNTTLLSYDPATLQVSQITDPLGQSQTFTYDALGNRTSSTDALGNKTVYTYGALTRLTSLTDASGDKTTYAYDPAGNLLSTTYANSAIERRTFDPQGDPLSFTNRRGQAINYTFNSAGQVTRQSFPDGTHTDFTYDSHGNLKTVTDATGTITFTYNAADRLTRVDYPGGQYLQFTLNAAGRRTQMVDQTGFTVNYTYDPAGRLSGLTDASGTAIVAYTYDAAGRLSRKDNGNGTSTTYQYDAAGNVLHLVNFAADNSVNSRFDYTYDALGRRTSMATVDGTWTYSYDGAGQLTHAVFTSTNPNVPGQDLAYSYDALGNRTGTAVNGVATAYTSDNMNEYVTVGGVGQQYDRDGNLLGDGTNTYTYDALDRLTAVTTPTGTTTFTYDALGDRSSSTSGGQVTRYLTDPTGLASVIGEFDGSGNVIAHDAYGLGLVSRLAGGTTFFYDFDATGNTAGLSGSGGGYVNRYSYLPYGGSLSSATTVSNPFQFAGQYAVLGSAGSLTSMRARFYDAGVGRFGSQDPLGILAKAPNAYAYAHNAPTRYVDPSGLWPTPAGDFQVVPRLLETAAGLSSLLGGTAVDFNLPASPLGAGAAEFGFYSLGVSPVTSLTGSVTSHAGLLPATLPDVGPGTPGGSGSPLVTSVGGPSDKLGPLGFGPANFVSATKVLPYRIDFQNPPAVTAPMQAVTITDLLASTLDWTTFRLTEISFGDTVLSIPANSQHFQTTVPVTYNGKTFNVRIEAGLRGDTGQVYATFQSLDPTTNLPPDLLTGFLPPEDGAGRGTAHVSYVVQARAGLPTGTAIRNVALITFDQNVPVTTDQVDPQDPGKGTDPKKETLVTLDAQAPTSNVNPLPVYSPLSFTVSWSGSDDAGGSGIANYTIYVSDNGSLFTPWLTATTQTSATYSGTLGHTYRFYSVATDNAGNRQATPAAAQATTTALVGTPAAVFANFVPGTGLLSISEFVAATGGSSGASLTLSGNTGPGGGATSLVTVAGGLGTSVNGALALTITMPFPGALTAINVSFLNDNDALTIGTATGILNLSQTTLNVTVGSGNDTLVVGTAGSAAAPAVNNVLAAVNFKAANRNSTGTESVSILNAAVGSISIQENSGPGDAIQLWGVTATGSATLTQNHGAGDTISVDQLNATNPGSPGALVPSLLGTLVTSQGNGSGDNTTVSRTSIGLSYSGSQGNGAGDRFFLGSGVTVGAAVASVYGGPVTLTQGGGSGDYLGLANLQAGVATLVQQDASANAIGDTVGGVSTPAILPGGTGLASASPNTAANLVSAFNSSTLLASVPTNGLAGAILQQLSITQGSAGGDLVALVQLPAGATSSASLSVVGGPGIPGTLTVMQQDPAGSRGDFVFLGSYIPGTGTFTSQAPPFPYTPGTVGAVGSITALNELITQGNASGDTLSVLFNTLTSSTSQASSLFTQGNGGDQAVFQEDTTAGGGLLNYKGGSGGNRVQADSNSAGGTIDGGSNVANNHLFWDLLAQNPNLLFMDFSDMTFG